jgi:hypothetical protein
MEARGSTKLKRASRLVWVTADGLHGERNRDRAKRMRDYVATFPLMPAFFVRLLFVGSPTGRGIRQPDLEHSASNSGNRRRDGGGIPPTRIQPLRHLQRRGELGK